MTRKQSITVGLPVPVLDAVERAREALWKTRGVVGNKPADWSRAQVIEFLICDGLDKHGIEVNWEEEEES